eukprot:gene16301-biopygen20263
MARLFGVWDDLLKAKRFDFALSDTGHRGQGCKKNDISFRFRHWSILMVGRGFCSQATWPSSLKVVANRSAAGTKEDGTVAGPGL